MRTGSLEVLNRIFPGSTPLMRSGARAVLSTMRNVPNGGNDYIIIDIESEVSNVLVVRDGLTTHHIVIPEGVRSIIERISRKGMPEDTLSLIRMIGRNECTGEACDAMVLALAKAEDELAPIFAHAFASISTPLHLPTTCFLITNPDLAVWLPTFFSRSDFSAFTLSAQPFKPHALVSSDLSSMVTPENGVLLDIELALACSLVNIDHQ
jgi:hypothetical protein